MEDFEILKMIEQQPETGLRKLMEAYTKMVYSTVSQKLKIRFPQEEIEDCVEEVFIDFYFHKNRYQAEKGSLQAYLRTMALHKANDRLRVYYREENKISIDEMLETQQPKSSHDTEEALLHKERDALLLEIVGNLDEVDHEIIMRKYYFREPSKVIAKRLHMSVSAVDTRASRILKRLRLKMEEQGYQFGDFS